MDLMMLRGALRFFPQSCFACGLESHNGLLCAQCRQALACMPCCCQRCAKPMGTPGICGQCLQKPPPYARTYAALAYQPPLKRLIHAFKYQQLLLAADFLAEQMAYQLRENPFVAPDIWLPVPLHRSRLIERGFNQAVLLAKPLQREFGGELSLSDVIRQKATPKQVQLNREQRLQNLQQAFVSRRDFTGKRIAIVDDVKTTGATVWQLAKVLNAANAKAVVVVVAARAV